MSDEQNEYTDATLEQATELMRLVMLYMQANGLNVGVSLVMAGATTIRTAGNMNPAQQLAVFSVLAQRLQGDPDIVVEIDDRTGAVIDHATH